MNQLAVIRFLFRTVILCISLTLFACGGGGSEGEGGKEAASEIIYEGKTSGALVTANNANKLFSEIWGGGTPPPVLAKGAAKGLLTPGLGLKLGAKHWIGLIANHLPLTTKQTKVVFAAPVNDTVTGRVSGTLTLLGDLNENGIGTFTGTFNNFNDGDGSTIDGNVTFIVRAFDLAKDLALDMEVLMQPVTFKDAEGNFSMSGSLRFLTSLETNTETMVLNVVVRNNIGGEMTKLEAFKLTTTYDDLLNPASFSEDASGRIFIASEGFVDFSTPTPFQYDNFPQENPSRGGPVLFKGAEPSQARAVAQSSTRVRIEVDLDGNGVLEDVRVYLWDDLAGSSVPNNPPQLTGLRITPENAVTTDHLTADFDLLNDPDGDNLSIVYAWTVNGTSIPGEESALLPPSHFSKGDEVRVTASVSDGIASETFQAVIIIQNTHPSLGTLRISPESAFTVDNLSAALDAVSDVDGDALSFGYTWRKNGGTIPSENGPSLAANHFVKGDTIVVSVSVSDGIDTVTADSTTVTILDSPPIVNASSIPGGVLYGQAAVFPVHATDADNDVITYKKTYGPQGLAVNPASGEIIWTPSGPMFDDQVDIHFGLEVTAAGLPTPSDHMITVSDPGRQQPLVRSGYAIPFGRQGLVVADFNGDGRNEILVTDHDHLLQTLVLDGVQYVQDWVKPFIVSPDEKIQAVAAHDLSGDGNPDILVALGSRILFLDGVTRKAFGEITGLFSPFGLAVADIENDGRPEIVFMDASAPPATTQRSVFVYSSADLSLKWQSDPVDFLRRLVLGNVDADPALEIITEKGKVWDGASHLLEWSYDPGFKSVDTGDVDGDGVEEIFSLGTQVIQIFKLASRSLFKEIPFTGISSDRATVLYAANIDSDPQTEVMVGYGGLSFDSGTGLSRQQATVAAIDSATGIEEWTQDTGNSFITSIFSGDADNDGFLELIWSAREPFLTLHGNLIIAGLNPSIQIEWTNEMPNQLKGSFIGARWLSTRPGFQQAVFATVKTEQPAAVQSGTRLIAIDSTSGRMTLNSDMGPSLRAALDGADYDLDGVDEIFLARNIPPRVDLILSDFDSGLVEWTTDFVLAGGFPFGGPTVTHGDLNKDGHDDFITLSSDRIIYAYDAWNDIQLWKSEPIPLFSSDFTHDIEVADLDGGGVLEIIALVENRVIVFGRNLDGSYSELRAQEVLGGNNLLVRDVDGDSLPEIIVVADHLGEGGFRQPGGIFLYDGSDFSLKSVYATNRVIDDIIATPNASGKRNLLIATVDQELPFVAEVDPFVSQEIWRSPGLIGRVQRNSMSFADTNNDGRQEMLMGTSEAMYITR